jgi:hypothetical protein
LRLCEPVLPIDSLKRLGLGGGQRVIADACRRVL